MFTSTTARVNRFRHVVFTEPGMETGPAINFAPDGGERRDGDVAATWGRAERSGTKGEDAFLRWLFRTANLDAGRYRPESLRRRVGACLRAVRATSPAHARLMISRNPSLMTPALGALLIGVTSLWRDPAVVAALASALPGVAAAAGRGGVRVWSAGCSHGAELYTVAVVMADLGILPRAYLLGTDCRAEAARRAAEGVFDAAEARNVPPPLLREYFAPVPGGYRVRADLRAAATWRTADVLKVHEPGTWDLILCRNVAMYLTSESAAALWARFEASLRPGGLLVLGRAERPVAAGRMATVAPCIYKRSLG